MVLKKRRRGKSGQSNLDPVYCSPPSWSEADALFVASYADLFLGEGWIDGTRQTIASDFYSLVDRYGIRRAARHYYKRRSIAAKTDAQSLYLMIRKSDTYDPMLEAKIPGAFLDELTKLVKKYEWFRLATAIAVHEFMEGRINAALRLIGTAIAEHEYFLRKTLDEHIGERVSEDPLLRFRVVSLLNAKRAKEHRHAKTSMAKQKAIELYKMGSYRSPHDASYKIRDEVLNFAKSIGLTLSPVRAQKTIYDWLLEDRRQLNS